MHPKLIKANIALFNGSRSEARLLLDEYLEEDGDPTLSLVLWLDAQTQNEREDRLERLRALAATVGAEDRYGRMALEILREEKKYAPRGDGDSRHDVWTIIGVPLWKMFMFTLLGGAVTFGALSLLKPASSSAPRMATDIPTLTYAPPTNTPLIPDHSLILPPGAYTVSYPQGIFQVVAVEDRSERVVDSRQNVWLTPVPGGRFYAIEVIFECRSGICNDPPEAALALRLDGGLMIETRADLGIVGETILTPIAQGRTTTGWIVFEIPETSMVDMLQIVPVVGENQTPQPLMIALPNL